MYIYIYMYVYMRICNCIYTYSYTHIYIYLYIHMRFKFFFGPVYTCIYSYIFIYARTQTHVRVCFDSCVCINTYPCMFQSFGGNTDCNSCPFWLWRFSRWAALGVYIFDESCHAFASYPFWFERVVLLKTERWGAGVETQKNVRGEIGGWGRVPFNEPYAPSLSTIYDGA